MKYALISDIHANLDALESVLGDAASCGANQIVCLGDIVGYGPLPAETLRRVRETCTVVLAGNHDDAVSGRLDAKNFIDLASDAVSRHRDALSHDEIAYLESLPHTATLDGAALAHGDLTAPAAFRYIETADAAAANFSATDAQLVFVGHTHAPGIYLTGRSGRVYALGPEDFVLEDGKRYIVNIGSVGYPRESNGQCYSSYVLYDPTEGSVRFRKLPFAVSSILQRGRSRRRRNLVLEVIASLLAIATCGVIANLRWNDRRGEIAASTAESAALVERSVGFDADARILNANLKLERGSPSALLRIDYFDAEGQSLPPDTFTCKSSKGKCKIPKGAVRALLSVRPALTNATPRIKTFNPTVK